MTDTEINYKELCEKQQEKINIYIRDYTLLAKVIRDRKLWWDLPERFWDEFMEDEDEE